MSRDRTEAPAPGLYNICYVNGFQIQPGEGEWWAANHPDVILRGKDGKPVIDPDWDETMLAPTSPARRAELAGVIGEWIAKCAADGFDAVEIDNLDTFTRSHGLITEDDAVAQMRLFADAAHAVGLPIAQKNSAEIVGRAGEMGTDFAVAEECDRYSRVRRLHRRLWRPRAGHRVPPSRLRRRLRRLPEPVDRAARPGPGAERGEGLRVRRLLSADHGGSRSGR